MAFNLPVFDSDDEPNAQTPPFVRYYKNAPGPFYVVDGECMCSGLAPAEVPELLSEDPTGPGVNGEGYYYCYFGRQPETPEEIENAIRAMAVSETTALRYGGDNPAILQRLSDLGLDFLCDNPVPPPRPNPTPLWPRAVAPPRAVTPLPPPTPVTYCFPVAPNALPIAGVVNPHETRFYTVMPEGYVKQIIRYARITVGE